MTPVPVLSIEAGSGSGGSSASLWRLLSRLDRSRWSPHVIAHQRGTFLERLERDGVPIEYLPLRPHAAPSARPRPSPFCLLHNLVSFYGPLTMRLIHRMRHVRPGVVHVNNDPEVALAAIAAARLCHVPIACHVRTARPLTPFELWLVRWVDALIVLSEASWRQSVTQGVLASKIVHIPNGIDVERFGRGDGRAGVRTRLGIADTQPTIGVVSRLIPGKGLEVFLRAMRLLVQADPSARAIIVGDACETGSRYPSTLRQYASTLGLDGHVHFTGWSKETAAWYAACDVFVQPSLLEEGLPGVCLEAMAHKLPIVSTAVGGSSDLVTDSVTGRLVPPGDPGAMATALLDLLRDPACAKRMGQAGYERALTRFDIQRTVRSVDALYARLLRRRGRF